MRVAALFLTFVGCRAELTWTAGLAPVDLLGDIHKLANWHKRVQHDVDGILGF